MKPSSRTPEGEPNRCPVCGHDVSVEPSLPPGDATCPFCGNLLWFPMTAGLDGSPGLLKFSISDPFIRTKAQAIETILDRLVAAEALAVEHRRGVLAAVLKREELGSTGIGGGIAVPHAKSQDVASLLGAVAQFPAGVEFDSIDAKAVHLVYLIVSPVNRPAEHLGVLEAIAQHLQDRK